MEIFFIFVIQNQAIEWLQISVLGIVTGKLQTLNESIKNKNSVDLTKVSR